MAAVQFLHLTPGDLTPEGSPPAPNIAVGLGKGYGFPALETTGVIAAFEVPAAVTLGTGLTFSLLLADDVLNPGAGLVGRFGATVGPVGAITTLDENVSTGALVSCTEVPASVTMPAVSGELVTLAIAVPIADMNSLAAGGWCMIRIRRLGLAVADTHRGRIVLLGVDVGNT